MIKNEIHILSIDEIKRNEEFLLSILSKKRREKIDSFLDIEKRYQSLGSGYFFYKYTSGETTFEYNEYGKPLSDIFFNISHSFDYVIFTRSEKMVGIDIEKIREYKDKLVKYAFRDVEIHNSEDFYKYWTLKEAVGKAYGNGLIDTDIKSIPSVEGTLVYKDKEFETRAIKYKNYMISICVEGRLKEIELIEEKIKTPNLHS